MKERKKSVLLRLLPWIIVVLALAALVIFVGIPLYSPVPEDELAAPIIEYYAGDTKPMTIENESLKLVLDPTTTQFVLTEKGTGRVWRSNPDKADKDPVANASNKENLNSTLIVTYGSSSGVYDRNNYKYSIVNGVYTIDRLSDTELQVNYAIGDVEKIYIIPTAITKERFEGFTKEMDSKTKRMVTSNYSLCEPSKLDKKKNKDELIELYPEVLNQALYILDTSTAAKNKLNMETAFAAMGYNEEEFAIDQELVAGSKKNESAVFNVSVIYRLDGDDFVVEIPYEKIRYRAGFTITNLTVLPYFGATGTKEEGFMLVPEGGGALIRYNNGKLLQSSYFSNIYGWDYATERKEVVSETCNSFPMFGMTHEGGSFICMLEGAQSYGSLQADISGRTNSYNFMNVKYNILHSDTYNVSQKTPVKVYMYEKEMPDATIVQRYRFLDSDSYVDMAKAYGDYLKDYYPALATKTASEDVPVSVELVGAIDKKIVKFGLPIDSVVPTTTFEQAQNIVNAIADAGIRNLNVRMSGWCNGGVTQQVLTKVKVESVLGGKKGMKALIAAAKDKNVKLYFDGVTCFAYDSDVLDGFTAFTDAARYTTREQVKIYPYSKITYRPNKDDKPFYLVRPEYAQENAGNLISMLKDQGAAGVSFRDIGSLLSANYNPKALVTREQVKDMNLETVAEAHEAGQLVMVKKGFDYIIPVADIVTDMPLTGLRYALIDENVPVYQIAIHGLTDYTGAALNLAGDYVNEMLTCAEYGAGLNFTFMAESTQILQNTMHNEYFGASYESWKETALELATQYQADMAGLNCQPIVDHEKLDQDVTVTEYANGAKVYVNRSGDDFTQDGVTVPARSYIVKGGEPNE